MAVRRLGLLEKAMPAKKGGPRTSKALTKTPSEIAPGVFVGNWEDALRFEGARFCVLDEAPKDMPPATHVQIYDEGKDAAIRANLDRLADGVRGARAKGQPALIFCHQGAYRSPLAGAWYLHRAEGLPFEVAVARVVAARPKAKDPATWLGNYAELERA
jgi:hypothetical protein